MKIALIRIIWKKTHKKTTTTTTTTTTPPPPPTTTTTTTTTTTKKDRNSVRKLTKPHLNRKATTNKYENTMTNNCPKLKHAIICNYQFLSIRFRSVAVIAVCFDSFHLQHCCLDPGRSPLLDNRSGRGARSPKTVCLQIQWMPNKLQSSLSFSPTEL